MSFGLLNQKVQEYSHSLRFGPGSWSVYVNVQSATVARDHATCLAIRRLALTVDAAINRPELNSQSHVRRMKSINGNFRILKWTLEVLYHIPINALYMVGTCNLI